MLGEKNQKDGRILPPRRLRDIKTEVGEDTKALLKSSTADKGNKKARQTPKQVSLLPEEEARAEEAPAASPSRPDTAVINVKTMPDIRLMIEVRDLAELEKVGRTFQFINCFEREGKRTYFVGGYFYSENM